MSSEIPDFSLVLTCFNEGQGILEFHARLRATLDSRSESFEIVYVNDGSGDDTWQRLLEIQEKDDRVTLVDLFRNAGQCPAISAGIEEARGRHFVFMDTDLQLEPEELPLLLDAFAADLDVVNGVRRRRNDSLRRRIASALANYVLRRVAGVPFNDFGCTFQVMHGDLVRAHGFGPQKPFHNILVSRSAGRLREVPVTHHDRPYGSSGWSTMSLWRYMVDNVVLYSQGMFQLTSLLAFLLAGLTVVRIVGIPGGALLDEVTNGFLLNALLLSTAFLVALVAFVGEYVLRSFAAHARGPLYVVRERRLARSRLEAEGAQEIPAEVG
jgi:glycosyltransferase involved in cell wall biosynthesis